MTSKTMEQNYSEYLSVQELENQTRKHSASLPMEPNLQEDEPGSDWQPKRSMSLETSPMIGIRLGSKTAQQAAKSFWNMDMYNNSLQKIAQYAAIESSSLGSSIESIDESEDQLNTSTEEDYISLFPIVPHLIDLPFSLTPRSAPSSPTQSPKMSLKRSKSACSNTKSSPQKKAATISRKISPAFPVPGMTSRVHFQLSSSQLSLTNEQNESLRRGSDDGYHEN